MQETQRSIKRGDLFYAGLNPVIGSEQGGIRPVLIIQNDIGNLYSPTVIVAAITSHNKKGMPTHVELGYIEALQKNSVVLLEQIRTIDRIRLLECVGSLDEHKMKEIDRALSISLGVAPDFF